MRLSKRTQKIALSTTLAIDEKVRALVAGGRTIHGFGAGEPDAPTPEAVREAGIEAIRQGHLRYTSAAGTLGVREAISRKLREENGLVYDAPQILVAAGAKQAIFMALAAILDPGDEVLVPSPYWVSYPSQIEFLGAVPRIVSTDESTGFKLTPEMLREALQGGRVRCLLLNTPSNPTGAVYTRKELEALGAVILDFDVAVITDEIYEYIVYEGAEHVSPVTAVPALQGRTAVVNGVSKSFAMTGWRIGYLAAPADWAKKATAVQSHLTGNACSISQEAARAAIAGDRAFCREMTEHFGRRRAIVLEALAAIPGIRICPPMGAFYAFPDVSAYFRPEDGVAGSSDLVARLIDEAQVATVPGDGFGSDRHLRISFAAADETLRLGMAALAQALQRARR